MPIVIFRVMNPMIRKTRLPYLELLDLPQAISKPTLDKLHRPFERDDRRRRKKHMNVIRHDNKFMQPIFPRVAIVKHRIDHQPRPRILAKNRHPPPRNRGNKERSLCVHSMKRSRRKCEFMVTYVTTEEICFQNGKDVQRSSVADATVKNRASHYAAGATVEERRFSAASAR